MTDWKPKAFDWLDERLGLRMARDVLDHKIVPLHCRHRLVLLRRHHAVPVRRPGRSPASCCCSTTGPTVAEAFDSVRFIMTQVEFGWLIRSIHSWSANLLIFVAFMHMFSVVFTHAYRRPRELTWLSGIALLGLMLGFGFSGYLLPWNQISYFATKVGTDVAASVPLVGPAIARFLRGGEDVGGATLTRFFAFHVMILPLITASLVGLHLLLVQKHGMSTPRGLRRVARFAHEVLPQLLSARADGLVRAAGGPGGAGRDLPLGTGREGRPVRLGPGGHPAGVVFPGAVLHPQAASPATSGSSKANCWDCSASACWRSGWVVLPFWGTRRDG